MSELIVELQEEIKREQKLLRQYEELERLEADPRNRLNLQTNIERAKENILVRETRVAQLRQEGMPAPMVQVQQPDFIANVPYGLETQLYGREQELALLDDWFHRDPAHPLMAVIGLGGQGKSALTWQWQKQLRAQKLAPPLVVWWSFYETDGTFDRLMNRLLRYFKEKPEDIGHLTQQVERIVEHLQQTPALIVLDGVERLLWAYQRDAAAHMRNCVDPVAGHLLQWLTQPGLIQARTLLTSRLFPQELAGGMGLGLPGVRRHDLTGLNGAAALALFQGLGIKTTRAEVEAVCEPLGYHPLSLRLLAREVRYSPTAPNDLRAAATYDPTSDLLGKREHVLKRAYESLPTTGQQLLSQLAAFRSSVAWPVLADVFGAEAGKEAMLRTELQRLEERGLLQRTVREGEGGKTETRYDLHPIVRRYAYNRLANPKATHEQLVVYFAAAPKPPRIHSLEDLQPAELYHHLTRAERYDEAFTLFRDWINRATYYQLGAYQTQIELLLALFPDGVGSRPRLESEAAQAWTLNELANSYSLAGQPAAAVPFFEQASAIAETQGNKKNLAIGLGNLAYQQMSIGALAAAAHNLRRRITLCRELEDRFAEAVGHQEYGRLLAAMGNGAEAAQALETALEQFKAEKHIQMQGITWAYRAEGALWQGDAAAALTAAQEALGLADEDARTSYPVERDYVQAHWLLGWAQLGGGALATAQQHLDEALRRCRAINLVEFEPRILLAQARLAVAQEQPSLAHTLATEAHAIAARAGYVLDLADICNLQAQLALAAGQREQAQQLAQQAYDYAYCDGPPHVYKPALDEAQRLLALSQAAQLPAP